MAQWIRRLPTEQEILGSSPGRVKYFFAEILFIFYFKQITLHVGSDNIRVWQLNPTQCYVKFNCPNANTT